MDANTIAAIALVATVIVAVIGILITHKDAVDALVRTNRPNIIFSRAIEVRKPLICTPTGQGNVGLHVWIKNIGNANAIQALPLPMPQLLRNGDDIEKVIRVAVGFCGATHEKTSGPGVNLAPNEEVDLDMPIAIGSNPGPAENLVQAFIIACIDYTDEQINWHTTCDIQRFISNTGKRDFICGRDTPVEGHFDHYPMGSCSN